jgi:hypothetical protein
MGQPISDFGKVLRSIFRFGRAVSYVLILLLGAWIAFRVAEVSRWAAGIHPWLGVLSVLLFAALLVLAVGRPLWRFFRVPVALRPPRLPDVAERRPRHLAGHLDFVERYVRALERNPEWTGSPEAVRAAVDQCRALRSEAAKAKDDELPALALRMAAIEHGTVAALLAPLDRKATDAIRAEATAVGISTAVSPNGTIDAFLVLWRACNLVSRIAQIYYGRPGPRGTLTVLRDVSAATLASAYLQELTEVAGGMVGAFAGKAAGALAGPVLDGSLNAIGTLRIGYVAKARCRAFSAWTERTRSAAVRGALLEAASLSRGVVTDLVKTVGGGILRLPARLLMGMTSAVAALFRPAQDPPPDPSGA